VKGNILLPRKQDQFWFQNGGANHRGEPDDLPDSVLEEDFHLGESHCVVWWGGGESVSRMPASIEHVQEALQVIPHYHWVVLRFWFRCQGSVLGRRVESGLAVGRLMVRAWQLICASPLTEGGMGGNDCCDMLGSEARAPVAIGAVRQL